MIIVEETIPFKLQLTESSNRLKWDLRFLTIAKVISEWSKDPSTKVGAIAINDNRRIIAQGYNGFPAGCKDDGLDDRISKYEKTIHAEKNIIYNACNSGTRLSHSTIYIFGMYPCPECIKGLAQVDVARVVFQIGHSENLEKWKNDFDLSRVLMHDLKIGFTHYTKDQTQLEIISGYFIWKRSQSPEPISYDDSERYDKQDVNTY